MAFKAQLCCHSGKSFRIRLPLKVDRCDRRRGTQNGKGIPQGKAFIDWDQNDEKKTVAIVITLPQWQNWKS